MQTQAQDDSEDEYTLFKRLQYNDEALEKN